MSDRRDSIGRDGSPGPARPSRSPRLTAAGSALWVVPLYLLGWWLGIVAATVRGGVWWGVAVWIGVPVLTVGVVVLVMVPPEVRRSRARRRHPAGSALDGRTWTVETVENPLITGGYSEDNSGASELGAELRASYPDLSTGLSTGPNPSRPGRSASYPLLEPEPTTTEGLEKKNLRGGAEDGR